MEAKEALIAEIEKDDKGLLLPIQEFLNTQVVGCSL